MLLIIAVYLYTPVACQVTTIFAWVVQVQALLTFSWTLGQYVVTIILAIKHHLAVSRRGHPVEIRAT